MPDTLTTAAITGVLGFLGGWALKYIGPKSKLVYWLPHTSFFQVPQPGTANTFNLMTSSVTVQNLGRRPATNVELVYTALPSHLTFTPARTYSQVTTPGQGQHVVAVPSLGHNEWFTIEVLGFGTAPSLLHVRSHDGAAQMVPVMQQRMWPRWVNWLAAITLLMGTGYLLYWALRGVKFLAKVLGFF